MSLEIIDLRSDTVTHPTPAMREAMATADVGDDVYGEDPTINRLQALAAKMLGKEAGLFVPSGTMGNLASVLAHCQRGHEMILGNLSHVFLYEAGGAAALGGVQPHIVQNQPDGTLALDDIRAAIRSDDPHFPVTSLVVLENTHNRCGGAVLTPDYCHAVAAIAKEHGLKMHLDGARLFNAAAALGIPAAELAAPFDSVTFCLSKGLSAPVGSVVVGSQDFIALADRARKQLGGGMRQAGILAAAGIVGLEQVVPRLYEDQRRAQNLASSLAQIVGIVVEKEKPDSNMVYIQLDETVSMEPAAFRDALLARGLKLGHVGGRRFRMVLHHWVDDLAVERAAEIIRAAVG